MHSWDPNGVRLWLELCLLPGTTKPTLLTRGIGWCFESLNIHFNSDPVSNNSPNILIFPFPQCTVTQINVHRSVGPQINDWGKVAIYTYQSTTGSFLFSQWVLDLNIGSGLGTEWVVWFHIKMVTLSCIFLHCCHFLWLLMLSSVFADCLFLLLLLTPCSSGYIHSSLWVNPFGFF